MSVGPSFLGTLSFEFSLLVIAGLASCSFTDPFFLQSPFSSNLLPDAPTIMPICDHIVLRHFSTCFGVLITAFGLSSRTHSMALHIPSAMTSVRKGNFISTQKFLAICEVFVQKSARVSSFSFLKRTVVSHSLILSRVLCPRTVFGPETDNTVDVFHHPSTLHSSRHVQIFIPLHQDLFALCILSSRQSSVFSWRFMVHPRILNFLSKGISWRLVLVSMERSVLSSKAEVLVHHKLAGFDAISYFLLLEPDPLSFPEVTL